MNTYLYISAVYDMTFIIPPHNGEKKLLLGRWDLNPELGCTSHDNRPNTVWSRLLNSTIVFTPYKSLVYTTAILKEHGHEYGMVRNQEQGVGAPGKLPDQFHVR